MMIFTKNNSIIFHRYIIFKEIDVSLKTTFLAERECTFFDGGLSEGDEIGREDTERECASAVTKKVPLATAVAWFANTRDCFASLGGKLVSSSSARACFFEDGKLFSKC